MKAIIQLLRRLLWSERAEGMVSYALIVGIMSLAAVYSLSKVSADLRTILLRQQEVLEEAAGQGGQPCANPNPGQFQGRSPCAPQ